MQANGSRDTIRVSVILTASALFATSFIYFLFFGNYALYFQETQTIFLFSADFLKEFLSRPGGLVEYAGRFVTQFYFSRAAGSLITALFIVIPFLMLLHSNRRRGLNTGMAILTAAIPSVLLATMQANYFHPAEFNLGIIAVLLLVSLSSENTFSGSKWHFILPFSAFAYYILGAFFIIFLVLFSARCLVFNKGKERFLPLISFTFSSLIIFFLSWQFIFLVPWQQLLLSPLPLLKSPQYVIFFIALISLICLYPFFQVFLLRFDRPILAHRALLLSVPVVIAAVMTGFFSGVHNEQTSRVVELERLAFAGKWKDAVEFHEKKPSRNLISEYFYNLALAESGQLCDRMFMSGQDFGTSALVLPWGDDHLNRGAYFYYAVGLFNEAYRWAYEEMVVLGKRPQNIEMLAKTALINGDYRMALKYAYILKKTLFYRSMGRSIGNMCLNPELAAMDPEISEKRKIIPSGEFFIQFNEPQNNLPLILKSQPGNRYAFEYYMAGHLLTKNVEVAVTYVKGMKEAGYTRIPRYIEEALLIYSNSTGSMPDLGGLEVSFESRSRFENYFNAYVSARQVPSTMKDKMQKQFGDTYWFYYHFK